MGGRLPRTGGFNFTPFVAGCVKAVDPTTFMLKVVKVLIFYSFPCPEGGFTGATIHNGWVIE